MTAGRSRTVSGCPASGITATPARSWPPEGCAVTRSLPEEFELRDSLRVRRDDFAIQHRLLRVNVMRQNL